MLESTLAESEFKPFICESMPLSEELSEALSLAPAVMAGEGVGVGAGWGVGFWAVCWAGGLVVSVPYVLVEVWPPQLDAISAMAAAAKRIFFIFMSLIF